MIKLLDLTVFVLIYLAGYFSLFGIGILLSKNIFKFNNNQNYFEFPIYGSILILILGYILHLSIGINYYLNIIICIFGLYLCKFYISKFDNKKILILLFSLISLLLISKTHEDFHSYHFFSIQEIFNHKIRIGVPEVKWRFIHSSLFTFNQALFVFPVLKFKLVHFPTAYIYLSTIGYFLFNCFNKKKSSEILYSLFVLIILITKINRLSEFGYDYLPQFLLLIAFHKILFYLNNNEEILKIILIFTFSVLIKPISLLFSPILLYIIIKRRFEYLKLINLKYSIIISFLIVILLSTSFFRSGCLFYPLNFSCFEKNKISWSKKEELKVYSKNVVNWARGFHHQDKSKYKVINNKSFFNKNYNWLKYWIDLHFFYKIFEFVLIVFASYIIIYLYFKKIKKLKIDQYKKDKLVLSLLSFSSIFFWLNTVPQFRFGFSLIIISIFLVLSFFLNKKIEFNKKKIIKLIFICLLLLNFRNIDRILTEIKREDAYKFNNFPWYALRNPSYTYDGVIKEKKFFIEILKRKN